MLLNVQSFLTATIYKIMTYDVITVGSTEAALFVLNSMCGDPPCFPCFIRAW